MDITMSHPRRVLRRPLVQLEPDGRGAAARREADAAAVGLRGAHGGRPARRDGRGACSRERWGHYSSRPL